MRAHPTNREDRRRCLLEAAARVFAEQGYACSRVADVAAAAGVAKGTVYEYFGSKQQLFFAVFEWMNRLIRERVDEVALKGRPARDVLIDLLGVGAQLVVEQRELYPVLNIDLWVTSRGGDAEGVLTRAVEEQFRVYRELLAAVIRRGQESGEFRREVDAESIATILVGTFDGLGMQYWLDGSIDPVRSTRELAAAVCRGLTKEER